MQAQNCLNQTQTRYENIHQNQTTYCLQNILLYIKSYMFYICKLYKKLNLPF